MALLKWVRGEVALPTLADGREETILALLYFCLVLRGNQLRLLIV